MILSSVSRQIVLRERQYVTAISLNDSVCTFGELYRALPKDREVGQHPETTLDCDLAEKRPTRGSDRANCPQVPFWEVSLDKRC